MVRRKSKAEAADDEERQLEEDIQFQREAISYVKELMAEDVCEILFACGVRTVRAESCTGSGGTS